MTIKLNSLLLACIFTMRSYTAMYALEAPATALASMQEKQSPTIVAPKSKTSKAILIAFNSAKILAGLNFMILSKNSMERLDTFANIYNTIPKEKLDQNHKKLGELILNKKAKALPAFQGLLLQATFLGLLIDGTRNLYDLLWKKEEQSTDKTPEPESQKTTEISTVIP